MSYDPNNVFARILRGELPRELLCEDQFAIAIMDAMPQSEGHALVITRESVPTIFEISPEGLAGCIRMTQRIAIAVRRAFEVPGVMVAQFNGAVAGQTVAHLHFHIVPRRPGEILRMHGALKAEPAQLRAGAERIRRHL